MADEEARGRLRRSAGWRRPSRVCSMAPGSGCTGGSPPWRCSTLLSGITIVKPDEVAVILRWGRLVGDTPALQEHGPGLLFAFPRPVDQVVRVQVKHVWEVPVNTLASSTTTKTSYDELTLDPLTQGYALTGDQNIVHVDMVARYRVRDPAEWAFYGPKAEDVLRVEVTAAMVRSLGEMGVDRVLSDGRKDLIATATRRAQAGLDAAHSGLELSSLELTRLCSSAGSGERFRRRAERLHRRGDKQERRPGLRGKRHPAGPGRCGRDAAGRPGAAPPIWPSPRRAAAFLALDKEYRANPRWFASASTATPWSRPSAPPAAFGGCRRRLAAATTVSASRSTPASRPSPRRVQPRRIRAPAPPQRGRRGPVRPRGRG